VKVVSLLDSSLDTTSSSSSSSSSSPSSTDYFTISQLTPDHSDGLLQNIQEIDYLAPHAKTVLSFSGGDAASSRHRPRGRSQGHPVPIFQKVVLSREQLLEQLEQLGGSLEDEEDEEDRQVRMLRQLVEQTMQHS
jgi:hypothetical protein